MAPPVGTLRVGRYFLALLAILAVLYAIVFWPGQRHTPKLGLDLVGGTQVIFTAKTDNGAAPLGRQHGRRRARSSTERVNGTGVTEATVVIQGTDQLVVSIPGKDATDVSELGAAAVLNFRGLVAPAVQVSCTSPVRPGVGQSSARLVRVGQRRVGEPASAGAVRQPRPASAPLRRRRGERPPAEDRQRRPRSPRRSGAELGARRAGAERHRATGTADGDRRRRRPSAPAPAAPPCTADLARRAAQAGPSSPSRVADTDFDKLTPARSSS